MLRHTLGCISVLFFILLTTTSLLRRIRHCPGRLLWVESGHSPGRHCPGRVLLRLPLHRRASRRVLRIYHRRSGRHMQAGKTHNSCIHSSLFSVNASSRAPGCCAGLLRWGSQDTSHDLVFSSVFCWCFLLLLISLLCCLYCVVSR